MVHDLIAVYQFIAAVFVTLCFDNVFKEFVWDDTKISIIVDNLNFTGNLENQEDKVKRVKEILNSKYDLFFLHAKKIAFVFFYICCIFLFTSSCSYWFDKSFSFNFYLIHHLYCWYIYIAIFTFILFVLFRNRLFSNNWFVIIIFFLITAILFINYYFVLYDPVISSFHYSADNLHSIVIGIFSIVVLILPISYYFLHGKIFYFVISRYITSRIGYYSKIVDPEEGIINMLNAEFSNDEEIADKINEISMHYDERTINRIYSDLERNDLIGMFFQSAYLNFKKYIIGIGTNCIIILRRKINKIKQNIIKFKEDNVLTNHVDLEKVNEDVNIIKHKLFMDSHSPVNQRHSRPKNGSRKNKGKRKRR